MNNLSQSSRTLLVRRDSESSSESGSESFGDDVKNKGSNSPSENQNTGDKSSGKEKGGKQPAPGMTSRPRAGTWSAMMPSSSAGNSTSRGQTSVNHNTQKWPAQALGLGRTDVSTDHTSTNANLSTNPVLSPRKGQIGSQRSKNTESTGAETQQSLRFSNEASTDTVTTTTTSMTLTTTTTTTTSTTGVHQPSSGSGGKTITKDDRTFATQLSEAVLSSVSAGLQSNSLLKPQTLGKLLVAVESKGGHEKLTHDKIDRVLRGGLVIHDFHPLSGGKAISVNVIESFCEPFMRKHLRSPALEQARTKFLHDFDKKAEKFERLSAGIPPKKWTSSSELQALMADVIQPVMELICGKDNSLETSQLPEHLKKLLLSIDKQVINWFEQSGTGKPRDLFNLRKNALINFLATRSISAVWLNLAKEKESYDRKKLVNLFQFLTSHINKKIDSFVFDLLHQQPDQPMEAKGFVRSKISPIQLKSKPTMPKLDLGSTLSSVGGQVLSPRSTGLSAQRRLAELGRSATVKEKREAQKKEMKALVMRAQTIDRIARESGLVDLDYRCYQDLKKSVVNMSERGYDHFQKNPLESCIKYVSKFYEKTENRLKTNSATPDKIIKALQVLAFKAIGNPFEEAAQEELTVASPANKTSSTNSTGNSTSADDADNDADNDSEASDRGERS